MQIYPSWFFPLLSPFNLEKRNGITRNTREFIVRLDVDRSIDPQLPRKNLHQRSVSVQRNGTDCHGIPPNIISIVITDSWLERVMLRETVLEWLAKVTWRERNFRHASSFTTDRNVTETRRITNIIVHEGGRGGGGILRAARSVESIPRDSSFFLD